MKIFISHSSKDKWAARRISEDLLKVGAQTFLDEKDIKTGQSIDHSIKTNLKVCQDFLIIVSPASIKSDWVLLELGGAIALEKNIIPIMLYVGVNEIPQIINLRLSRDINDIGLYYQEVIEKISVKSSNEKTLLNEKPEIKTTSIMKKDSESKYKIGQEVKITPHRPLDVFKNGYLVDWEEEMDAYLGQHTTIRGNEYDGTYTLEIDKGGRGGGFVWAEEWILPVK